MLSNYDYYDDENVLQNEEQLHKDFKYIYIAKIVQENS